MDSLNSDDNGQDSLAHLGITSEEVEASIEQQEIAPYAKQICICGHPMVHHSEFVHGKLWCVNGRMQCPCQKPTAVLLAQDVRYFSRKTEGYGARHALTLGIYHSLKAQKSARFLVKISCKLCLTEIGPLLPTAVTPHGRPSVRPEKENVFLCKDCIMRLSGVMK